MRHRLLLLGLLVFSGCAALESKSRMEQLDTLTRRYGKALAWSDFGLAFTATKASQEISLPEAAFLKDIKITAYEPTDSLVEQDGKVIRRTVRIRFVHTSRMAEHSMTTDEVWKYSDEDGRWYLQSGFPKFRLR